MLNGVADWRPIDGEWGIGISNNPLLYSLKIAYTWILIPGTMGAFIAYIALDARRRWLDKNSVVAQVLAEEDVDEYDFEK